MEDFLRTYWDEIVALITKIYEAIKAALIAAEE